ncbi:MAG: NifB/NifX family molybdenum-iron cluster-binding protein [Desulfobacteraceae bacterium]|nr:NifB/NifX family molybdenum-iron cluster-binding protein [Desulfobacteraceae bacterium]
MKIAFPTQEENGLSSQVYTHFGSAETFLIVDTETNTFTAQSNRNLNHQHGHCQPLVALGTAKPDAVAVAGIGRGALMQLVNGGVKVYRAVEGTITDNLALVTQGKLSEFSPDHTCAGHGPDGGCAH